MKEEVNPITECIFTLRKLIVEEFSKKGDENSGNRGIVSLTKDTVLDDVREIPT
ncbi:hypothetical protein [Oceanobacillus sp. FSL W7-1309]|uniref:hypothetical protein n=1 Tax=Oceanobacillus sp. FSL W7-1309 TaxID=2954539 RepID=UPI0030F53160